MKTYLKKLLLMLPLVVSCEQYLEIDSPKDQLVGTHVFEEAATVDGAFAHIHATLRESAFTTGSASGLSYLMGHYTDELFLVSENQDSTRDFYLNSVLPTSSDVAKFWNTAYNLIYNCNRIMDGVQASGSLAKADKNRFMGEAYFIRAFIHFNMVNLFGDIPYVDTMDYKINAEVGRMDGDAVYDKVLEDAQKAKEYLLETAGESNVFRPNYWTATAFLARVHLYRGEWELAKQEAERVISDGPFVLEPELENVFLKQSRETLWQLDNGTAGTNTYEGFMFIAMSAPPTNTSLTQKLVDSFEEGDARWTEWVGAISDSEQTWYYPFKYKHNGPTETTMECSILFRLAEMYLTAAEAAAHMGQATDALYFLNAIRNRCSLNPLDGNDSAFLLASIAQERNIEFFSEQGHRFFDLKRTGKIDEVLSLSKPYWDTTDVLLPLPEDELLSNPNLLPQNEGY